MADDDKTPECTRCGRGLAKQWRYCPMCGEKVEKDET